MHRSKRGLAFQTAGPFPVACSNKKYTSARLVHSRIHSSRGDLAKRGTGIVSHCRSSGLRVIESIEEFRAELQELHFVPHPFIKKSFGRRSYSWCARGRV